ncbi:hypothetical protein [Priestia flexa]|uniref:hypothetical protein n=1 Tax=Priestia flexa TaxID=86664 RepID=UPI000473B2AA|nr:hypothetical protein [Priestia flexa]
MTRLYNTFEFVGNISIPKNADRFHKVQEFNSGWTKHTINFAVQESKTNSVFVQLEGGYSQSKPNKVHSFGKGTENVKGTKLEIPWEDRLKPETVDMVADFKKIVVDYTTDEEVKEKINQLRYEIRTLEYKDELTDEEKIKVAELKKQLKEVETDRNEFIHEYDAIQFLSETLEKHKDKKFRITGSVTYSAWKGKFYRNFVPELIELVSSEEPNKLHATVDIFFTDDSLDETDLQTEKKIYIDGYVLSYDSQVKKDQFFPQQFVINAQKLDFENEAHVKRLDFFKKTFKDNGEGVYHLQWLVNIFRGADQVDFTEEDLTEGQKEAIALGLNKLEDFKPKGGMLGETKEENRLVKPILKEFDKNNDFREGAAESTYDVEDLEYVAAIQKEQPKKEETKEETLEAEEVELDDMEDLFS